MLVLEFFTADFANSADQNSFIRAIRGYKLEQNGIGCLVLRSFAVAGDRGEHFE